jgi:hypothetical protein
VQLVEFALAADEAILLVRQIGRNLSFPPADSGAASLVPPTIALGELADEE